MPPISPYMNEYIGSDSDIAPLVFSFRRFSVGFYLHMLIKANLAMQIQSIVVRSSASMFGILLGLIWNQL